jgi:SAM-dependent methyltransferase
MAETLVQHWDDAEFCRMYAETWEISTDQVHYGWLAPGEDTLQLLADFPLRNANVLDLGCGMGENLICLSNKGARCFGVDISSHMVNKANENARARAKREPPKFVVQDMRRFTAFPELSFDLILSVYSLEYLRSTKELRDVCAMVASRLKPGGTFVFCFSHPLQHFGHANLQNHTGRSDETNEAMLIYSFRDVMVCLDECKLTADRIIEQITLNPSRISYQNSLAFPYHFHEGKNPCVAKFDSLSNRAPHTVIYKARKLALEVRRDVNERNLPFETIALWGEPWMVIDKTSVSAVAHNFEISKIRRGRECYILCEVLRFEVGVVDLLDESDIFVPLGESLVAGQMSIARFTLLGILLQKFRSSGLHAVFRKQSFALEEHPEIIHGVFMSRVERLSGRLEKMYPGHRFSLLVFVNGDEPGSGKVGLDSFIPRVGDRINVIYLAEDKPNRSGPSMKTELLPGFPE